MQGHWAPPFLSPSFVSLSLPFPSVRRQELEFSSSAREGLCYFMFVYLYFLPFISLFILFVYFFSSFDTIFDWLTHLSAMF